MMLHENYLAWAYAAAISVSFAFAMIVIYSLMRRVFLESRQSDEDEYYLYKFLETANTVLHEYYSKRSQDGAMAEAAAPEAAGRRE
jgi:hypothetical protein